MVVRVDVTRVGDFAALGARWRALEEEAAALSFFQSWTWVGCLAEERYPDPWLLCAQEGGRTTGLALLNRRGGRLVLTGSGEAATDSPYVEHNAPLLAAGAGPEVLRALLGAARRVGGARRLVLPGVPPEVPAAAGGVALRWQEQPAPFVDLDAVRTAGGGYLDALGANTRYQLRRSARQYGEGGPLVLDRAETVAEASAALDALIVLHGASWRRRGRPGAFAQAFMPRFHHALLARAVPRGEADLLSVSGGRGTVLGHLYNFRLRGRVYAYQSGLNDAEVRPHGKPGLTCHHLAVERALTAGDRIYDFLAGAARYKRNLANACAPLLWTEMVPAWSVLGLVARLRRVLRHRSR